MLSVNCCRSVVWGCLLAVILGSSASGRADEPAHRLATVNGHAIQPRDVELELLVTGTRTPQSSDRDAALERVIDRTLIAHFVASKGADPLAEDVENLVQLVRKGIESGGDTVDVVLGKLKLTEDDVRKSAHESLSWQAYVRRTVKEEALRTRFQAHPEQFNGTQVRISQIVLTIPATGTPADWATAEMRLSDLRQEIESKKLDFAAAAAAHSQSPSGKQGGDVGFIRFQGDVPAAVAAAAFALKPGEMSQLVRSTLGVHLVRVTEIKPGELSLEDARPQLLRVLGEELWVTTVQTLRKKAKIVKE